MKELWLDRVSVNRARVIRRNEHGSKEPATGEMDVRDAQWYIVKNQRDLKIYKIAYILPRKNGIRHLRGAYYFATDEDAIKYFETVSMPGYILQLLTGDWRLLAQKQPEDINK